MSLRILSLVAVSLLAACGGSGGDIGPSPTAGTPPTVTPPAVTPTPAPPAVVEINGAVQKGPFLVGSTVLVNLLDARGQSTTSTIVSKIEDSIGSFSFVTSQPGPAQLVASGFYFSELTGQISSAPITLRALYDISSEQGQIAYVNILTHLINERALKLFSVGNVTLADAIAQAESELLAAFSSALPVSGIGTFSELNIYSTSGGSSLGDVYLLALSTAFYKYASDKAQRFGTATDAELTLILNQLADDLEDDGRLKTTTFMNDFIRAVRMLSPETISSNLRSRSLVDYPQGLGVPDVSVFLHLCAGTLECPWRAGAPVPLPAGMAVGYGGKVYLLAAQSPSPSNPIFEMLNRHSYEYDPVLNEWSQIASMPVDGPYPVGAVIGDKIYVHSGSARTLLEYTPATNQWRELPPRPSFTRYGYTTAVVDGKLYVIGGTGGSHPDPVPQGDVLPRGDVDIYDPATNIWTRGRSTPMPLETWSDSCVHDGQIYVFGGNTSLGSPVETFVWSYSPSQDSWSAKSPMTLARHGVACVEVGDQFYLFGGNPATGTAIDLVERFDPLRQAWSSPTRLPTPRWGASAVAIGHRIFIVGGTTKQPDFVEILDTDAL